MQDFVNVGPFNVNFGLSVAEQYTDNVFVTKNNKNDDFITIVEPVLDISVDTDPHELNFRAGAEIGRYASISAEDYEDYFVGADGRFRFDASTFMIGGLDYSWDHEDRESPDDVNGLVPTEFNMASGYAGVAHRSENFLARAGVNVIDYNFDDVQAAGGAVINNDDRDRTHVETGARIGYRFDQQYELFVQGTYDDRNYDSRIDDFGFRRDSDGYRVAGGVRGPAGPAVQGEIYAGVIDQDYVDPLLEDVTVFDFGGRLDWQPTSLTQLTAFVDRSLRETTLPGASGYLSTAGGADVTHQARPDLSVGAHLFYTENDYRGIGRLDRIIDAGLGAQYFFLPNFYVGTDYAFLQRNSNVAGADFDENRFLIRLGAQLAPGFSSEPGDLFDGLAASGLGGFYAGVQFGHGNVNTGLDGPRGAGGRNTADFGDDGITGGGFVGYGAMAGSIYLGVELDAEASSTEWRHNANRTFSVRKRDNFGASARLGYQLDNEALLYGRFGIVGTEFETPYRQGGNIVEPTDRQLGLRFGGGTDFPVGSGLFGRMEYTYTSYQDYNVAPNTVPDNFSNTENLARFGLGYRFHAADDPDQESVDFAGFYVGGQVGHGALTSDNAGNRAGGGGFFLEVDRAGYGATGGVFGGFGHMLGPVFVGAEFEAELSSANWNIEREPTGRIYSVEKDYTVGASLRAGYVVNGAVLIYGRAGLVRTRFENEYSVGANFVSPETTETGKRFGGGVEMAAGEDVRLRFDYSYTRYDDYVVDYISGVDSFDNSENLFRVGLGYAL